VSAFYGQERDCRTCTCTEQSNVQVQQGAGCPARADSSRVSPKSYQNLHSCQRAGRGRCSAHLPLAGWEHGDACVSRGRRCWRHGTAADAHAPSGQAQARQAAPAEHAAAQAGRGRRQQRRRWCAHGGRGSGYCSVSAPRCARCLHRRCAGLGHAVAVEAGQCGSMTLNDKHVMRCSECSTFHPPEAQDTIGARLLAGSTPHCSVPDLWAQADEPHHHYIQHSCSRNVNKQRVRLTIYQLCY